MVLSESVVPKSAYQTEENPQMRPDLRHSLYHRQSTLSMADQGETSVYG
jgi:hypothetical protein